MPEVQAANAGEVTTHKHPYWTTMADDCNRHPGSACVHQEQQVSSGHTGLLYYMGRCQTAPRPDSHKNHSRTVLHIRHPRNRTFRPGSKLRKQHRPEYIGCIWGTEKPYHTLSPTGMEWSRGSTAHCSSCCEHMSRSKRTGKTPATGPVYVQDCYTHLHWHVPIPTDVWKAPQPNTLTPSRGYEARGYKARGYEATSYQAVLQAKIAERQDLVEAHIVESAHRQKVDEWSCQYLQQAS